MNAQENKDFNDMLHKKFKELVDNICEKKEQFIAEAFVTQLEWRIRKCSKPLKQEEITKLGKEFRGLAPIIKEFADNYEKDLLNQIFNKINTDV